MLRDVRILRLLILAGTCEQASAEAVTGKPQGNDTVPKVIDFPRYNTKCRGENEILRGIFHIVSRFPLYFVLYIGNLNYFLDNMHNT